MSAEPKELYSLLIPLKSERLLVPRMCVAEVIAFADAARSRDDAAPDWYLGAIEWNNRRLPVVSFDGQRGDEREIEAHADARRRLSRDHAGAEGRVLRDSDARVPAARARQRRRLGSRDRATVAGRFSGAVPSANDSRVSADSGRRAARENDRGDAALERARTRLSSQITPQRLRDRANRERGGFDAQDARAERHARELRRVEPPPIRRAEPALGAHGHDEPGRR